MRRIQWSFTDAERTIKQSRSPNILTAPTMPQYTARSKGVPWQA
ncbi:MAG: hypothetical protein WCI02_09265 [Planctomycetota bacterium]